MKISRALFFFAILFMSAVPFGCNSNGDGQNGPYELVIYCENGILEPVREITGLYEKATGLNVKIRNDCARNLVSFLHYRDEADIFIPDAAETLTSTLLVDSLFFNDITFLGHQSLIFFVQKGNPQQFDGQLKNLFKPKNGMVLANPESSSLGLLTGVMLKETLLYDEAITSVLFLTIDSRNLVQTIVKKQASLVIGWESDYNEDLLPHVDTVHIKGAAPDLIHHKASAALLHSAPHKDEARRYLELLTSPFAKRIFEKYGIRKDSLSGT